MPVVTDFFNIIEPVHPFQGCIFDSVYVAPWPTPANDLRFEQADDRLGQGIVVRVTNAAD